MKNKRIGLLIALFLIVAISSSFLFYKYQTEKKQKITTSLDIKGMTCQSCSITLTKKLKNLHGIKNVYVDLERNKADITYLPKKVSISKMIQTIENEGYKAQSTQKLDLKNYNISY